jgi:two-component system, NarL family, invasion response regulator UvrY
MIRVLVADDHVVVRKGLIHILAGDPEIAVVGEAANYGELRKVLQEAPVDVMLLDIQMPGRNGLEIAKFMKQELPRLQIIILSMYPEDQYAVRALRAGASAYLSKSAPPEILLQAIKAVAAGRKYISAEVAQALAERVSGDVSERPHEDLSDRELQVLKLISSGKRLADIARDLSISPKTVSVYRARILEKMGLESNAELTHYALKNNLVT